MKKKEALKYIRKEMEYVPYIGIFELYDDEDHIPEDLITLSCREIKEKDDFIICSSKFARFLNKL